MNTEAHHERARTMLNGYSAALFQTGTMVDVKFDKAVDAITALDSLLVITGLGKSGLIGQKAAATFSSTGTRAVFVHPVEALHGDSGVVEPTAGMLAISKGGGNSETIEFVRQFKTVSNGVVITITEPDTKLSELANIPLFIPQLEEIDEWDLAPTTSTMTTMGICDVLAICVQQKKGLTAEHFAQFHPQGTLGKRLRLKAGDFMVCGDDLPVCHANLKASDVIFEISSKGLGTVILVDENERLIGTITDGDIRRLLERHENVLKLNAMECFRLSRRSGDLPQPEVSIVSEHTKAIECLEQMQRDRITSLVVVKKNRPVGLVRMQDLVAAGL